MKKYLAFVLAILLLLTTASPAFAGREYGKASRYDFTVVGYITALDDATLNIDVVLGSRSIRSYIGTNIVVQITPETRFIHDGVSITYGDLTIGDGVSVSGRLSDGAFIAYRVTLDPDCLP